MSVEITRSAVTHIRDILYLRTPQSTRTPAGVMVSNRNLFANFKRRPTTSYYGVCGKSPRQASTVVSWLPFHQWLCLRPILPIRAGIPAADQPDRFPCSARLAGYRCWQATLCVYRRAELRIRSGVCTLGRALLEGLFDLGGEARHPRMAANVGMVTLKRFTTGSPVQSWTRGRVRNAEAIYIATRKGQPKIVQFDPQKRRRDGQAERTSDGTPPVATASSTPSWCASSTGHRHETAPRERSVRFSASATTSPSAIIENPRRPNAP